MRLGVGLAACGLAVACATGVWSYAALVWWRQNPRADAQALIRRELAAVRPGYDPLLTVRLFGSDSRSRSVCVYEADRHGHVADVYMLQYRFGVPVPQVSEQYTPRWPKNGGIVRDLCLHHAAEPPSPA